MKAFFSSQWLSTTDVARYNSLEDLGKRCPRLVSGRSRTFCPDMYVFWTHEAGKATSTGGTTSWRHFKPTQW
ncbi:hypothetical protein PGTUg99_019273 [Puccinia graminis f. sp. tritici]|uniref:Uncharacterized protein n=1 Tax=Puccinia graminis f. sp. tritici TaxID=56615 RepID=A0A5B0PH63_PUCGR|nr:hypothetical protein PGTUg99_019273 [Puccinia graminis f. sp. tritici]